MKPHTDLGGAKTWKEAVELWNSGKAVWSAELGGIGPGYEQAIQVLLWSTLASWKDDSVEDPVNDKYPEKFEKHFDNTVCELDKAYGFSGAQAGAAKNTAYKFLKYGYLEMMNKLPENRHILVSKNFPSLNSEPRRED